jgi:hypothetical protein
MTQDVNIISIYKKISPHSFFTSILNNNALLYSNSSNIKKNSKSHPKQTLKNSKDDYLKSELKFLNDAANFFRPTFK